MKGLLSILIVFSAYHCSAQNKEDAIIGKWLKTPKEDMIIEVYKLSNEFQGKIAWTKIKDQTRAVGFVILDKLKYDPKSNTWEDGNIHDPRSGKTYTASVQIKPDGMLEVNGYLGFKFFGKKKNFKRVNITAGR